MSSDPSISGQESLERLRRLLEEGERQYPYADEAEDSRPTHCLVDRTRFDELVDTGLAAGGEERAALLELQRLVSSSHVFQQHRRLALPLDLTDAIIARGLGEELGAEGLETLFRFDAGRHPSPPEDAEGPY